jgi:LPS O-antigen subunit length determinant protein (WzzB/FepE family)
MDSKLMSAPSPGKKKIVEGEERVVNVIIVINLLQTILESCSIVRLITALFTVSAPESLCISDAPIRLQN